MFASVFPEYTGNAYTVCLRRIGPIGGGNIRGMAKTGLQAGRDSEHFWKRSESSKAQIACKFTDLSYY